MGRKQPKLKWSGSQQAMREHVEATRPKKKFAAPESLRPLGGKRKWWKDYSDYLESDWWRQRRFQKLRRVGFVCERCGTNKELQVHHLHYRTVGREKDEDLQVLCDSCHTREHERLAREKKLNGKVASREKPAKRSPRHDDVPGFMARRKLNDVGHKCQRCGGRRNLRVVCTNPDAVGQETDADVEALCRACRRNAKEFEDQVTSHIRFLSLGL